MEKYILAHDLGTSGNKATLYDLNGNLCSSTLYEYPTYYPGTNCVEQDPEDWWKSVCITTRDLMEKAGVAAKDISCVCFSAHMMSCLPVDREGNPLRKSIIWADMRGVRQTEYMVSEIGMKQGYRITGHRIGPSYSAAKILWVRDNEPDIFNKTYKVLQVKDYLLYKLTGAFVTDYSDAAGTNLFDLVKKEWSEPIFNALKLNRDILPELHPSTDVAGTVTPAAAAATGLLEGTPVVIGGGDGSCAAVGAGVVEEGKTYNVIGSSSWISLASRKPVFDDGMKTFNFIHLDPRFYTPCGSMQTAGYSVNWLKNTLCELEVLQAGERKTSPYKLIDEKIMTAPAGSNGMLYLPYLLGERSPWWNPDAKGAFIGLKMTTNKADILRSVLEGVGYNLRIILETFEQEIPVEDVILIGGGAKGSVWLQILADIWQKPLRVPEFLEEATSMGAAVCGGVGVGAFKDFKVIDKFNKIQRTILPREENKAVYDRMYKAFSKAYEGLAPVFGEL